jgi:hypothetical protein
MADLQFVFVQLLAACLAGCASVSDSSPAMRQRAEADFVINFQSWNALAFLKPDITGTVSGVGVRLKTFTADGFVLVMNNLNRPRNFVVVALDRSYSPDPAEAKGGMETIEKFFRDLGFQRIVFQDGSAWDSEKGYPILRDHRLD